MAIGSCEFLKFQVAGFDVNGTVGIFRVSVNNGTVPTTEECTEYYYGNVTDPYVLTAKIASVIGIIGAGAVFLMVLFEVLICRVCCARLFESLAWMCAQIGTALAFTMYNSEVCRTAGSTCSMGEGTIFNIAAWGAYFVAGLLTCCTPKPKPLLARCCKRKEPEEDNSPSSPVVQEGHVEQQQSFASSDKASEGNPTSPSHASMGGSRDAEVNYALTGT